MALLTETDKYILDRAISNLQRDKLESLSPQDQNDLNAALLLYIDKGINKIVFKRDENPYYLAKNDLAKFFSIKPYDELITIRDYQPPEQEEVKPKKDDKSEEKEDSSEEKQEEAPKKVPSAKEVSTVPPDLKERVLAFQEAQAGKLDANTKLSVADAILRAQKVWERKNRIETILKNRTDAQKEKDDIFYIESVDPKKTNREALEFNVRYLARNAVIAQAANLGLGLNETQITKATDDLTFAGLAGAVDLTDFNDLNIVSQLAFIKQGIAITSPVNNVLNVVQAWKHASEIEPDPEELEKYKKQLSHADEDSQRYINTSTKNFSFRLKNEVKNHPVEGQTIDLEEAIDRARTTTNKIQSSLHKAIPNPESISEPTPLQIHEKEIEAAIRKDIPGLLINDGGLGSRAAATVKEVKAEKLDADAIRLFALGLSPEEFNKLKLDPKSKLSEYLDTLPDKGESVFQHVHTQLRKIAGSKLGQEIKANSHLEHDENGKTVTLSGLSKSVTGFYNGIQDRLPPGLQNVAKFALDPAGSIRSWINKKIGEKIGRELLKETGSALSKKLGNYLLTEGLQGGVKAFLKDSFEKVALKIGVEAAKKAGISLAAKGGLTAVIATALGIPTAGVSLVIGAVALVIQVALSLLKKGFNKVWQTMGWGEFRWRDLAAPVVAFTYAGAAATAAVVTGFIMIVTATRVAAMSAIGIIGLSLAIIGFYMGITLLVAPILSTLVQLDSIEKVDYFEYATSSSDCGWPTAGHYQVIQGPLGTDTHSLSNLEAIDIWDSAIDGTPMLSSTDGVVESAGPYSNYGNTLIVNTTNSAGTFKVLYGHMSMISVSPKQQVKKGQNVGAVGGSGGWKPHIHFEYQGIEYNQCPAGGVKIPVGCVGFFACGSVYTN